MRKSPPTPLKRALFDAQVTGRELAAVVEISEGYLSKIVNGLRCDEGLQETIARQLTDLDSRDRVWTSSELFPTVRVAVNS